MYQNFEIIGVGRDATVLFVSHVPLGGHHQSFIVLQRPYRRGMKSNTPPGY
jgi:hypothetical protein